MFDGDNLSANGIAPLAVVLRRGRGGLRPVHAGNVAALPEERQRRTEIIILSIRLTIRPQYDELL
jgi:hypothetical protein